MADLAVLQWWLGAMVAMAAAASWSGGVLPAAEALGMNWGTQASHPLPPKIVAQLLQDNGIKKVKLFDADQDTLSALAGTGIEVMVAIPNVMLDSITDYDTAKEWVRRNVSRYNFDGGVTIKYVAVGNEPFLAAYNGTFDKVTLPALMNIQNALNDAGLGDSIKATVPLNADVYDSPQDQQVPSAGRFRADIADLMTQMVQFLANNSAPFTVNIYPFISLYLNDDFPVDFAFFDGGATPVVDNGISYTNVFDANFDTLVAALKGVGHGDMPIVVGEVGWPTDGDKHATATYAQRFYNGLLKRLAANAGTPARPGQYIEVYLFGLLDEDAKSVAPGDFERHWGILRFDGQPKYPVDLTGQGQNTMLVPAKGVTYLPRTWCVINTNAKDTSKLADNINFACTFADCTALGYGSTCAGMDANGNASYAFNAYFQVQNQKDDACDFQGLGMPTQTDPSTPACNFTIQIAATSAGHRRRAGAAVLALLALFRLFLLH
ncbi:glucan endo-1,3-beta-glucosidase 8-like [Oryza glaberrima]|uniref:glucan endo-1,3-beta-D-glucosidase n=2 Tax=Oryza TaxID=4527 RepID=A0A0D3FQ19_9ORYZ|nr:glucan endo-1,3-beta-glucosidase 8-like [Oryza glaberrima]XP_052145738.1 glucan endo-1,3-beta-glucosidase 8-like [Oryza glaberrima]